VFLRLCVLKRGHSAVVLCIHLETLWKMMGLLRLHPSAVHLLVQGHTCNCRPHYAFHAALHTVKSGDRVAGVRHTSQA
jgi:hypothetical protein